MRKRRGNNGGVHVDADDDGEEEDAGTGAAHSWESQESTGSE